MASDTGAGLRGRFDIFWRGRSQRERTLLGVAAAVVAFGVLYGLVYAPVERARARLAQRLPQLRAEQRLLTAQVAEIERLRAQGKAGAAAAEPLVRRVEASAMANGLRERVQSLAALGDGGVQVVTGSGPLEGWLRWLQDLRGQGVRVQSCRVSLADEPGQASLDAVLEVAK